MLVPWFAATSSLNVQLTASEVASPTSLTFSSHFRVLLAMLTSLTLVG